MAKLCLKKQSKRVPARKRYKILKKVREHNRKVRRESKKNPKKGSREKVVHVPNKCPFKEGMLQELQALKQQKEDEKRQRRQTLKEQKKSEKMGITTCPAESQDVDATEVEMTEAPKSLGDIMEEIEMKQGAYEVVHAKTEEASDETLYHKENMKTFYREFKKVAQAADVLLEVLDARDPLGTRCSQVEQHILQAPEKRLVFVLNKCDLVPRDNLTQWLTYLRQFYPTIPFKASTQKQRGRYGWKKMKKRLNEAALECSPCIGGELLMSLLNNYCRNKGIKTSITVGVVGLPNVGKSSIINSLKRSRTCDVGAVPGVTKTMKEVQLDSKIKLLDSPGVVFTDRKDSSDSWIALKNAKRVENVEDPLAVASAILQRADKLMIQNIYSMPEFSTPEEFFVEVAKRHGRFKKGGIPDTTVSARLLIDDWNRGKIRYFTVPPEEKSTVHISAEIVQTMAKEFDISSCEVLERNILQTLEFDNHSQQKSALVGKKNLTTVQKENDSKMEVSKETGLVTDPLTRSKKKRNRRGKKNKNSGQEKPDSQLSLEGNQKLNAVKKLQMKKLKKMKVRNERVGASLADGLETVTLQS